MLKWLPDTDALASASAKNVEAGLRGQTEDEKEESVDARNPWGCNGKEHKPGCPKSKGITREFKSKKETRLFRVERTASEHEQINQLTDAIIKASEDGERLETVIYRPEFGELILDCGHPGIKNPPPKVRSKGVGVQHALEERHNISARDLAEALIKGECLPHQKPSRLTIINGRTKVIIEREMKAGSNRISKTKAKIQTAMKEES